jgi:hydrogenase maturation protease
VKKLVLGVGNTIMGDDGVGISVVRVVRDRLRSRADIEVKEVSVSGFKLVEEMLGYKKVIIADSYASHDSTPGRIREFTPEDFKDTLHVSSPHGADFATGLRLYRSIEPNKVPSAMRIFTVDIHPTNTFCERLSEPVRQAALKLAELIVHEIERDG